MSENPKGSNQDTVTKTERIKEIEDLYHTQIKQIYNDSKEAVRKKQKEYLIDKSKPQTPKSPSVFQQSQSSGLKRFSSNENLLKSDLLRYDDKVQRYSFQTPELQSKANFLNPLEKVGLQEQKIRASSFLQGESARTIQVLRKQIESKEMKIRQLANRCQNLIEKLRNHLTPEQFQEQLANVKQFTDRKIQQLENLFKIRGQQIFFKLKIQIIKLLQEFQISKEEINGINQVNSQSALFSFMMRKLKLKLKDFKAKQNETTYQIQKDKIINQKYEQRIHYLMETNQLLKISEEKLKQKLDDLRVNMSKYIDRMKDKQLQVQDRENQIFRLKKQNQELQATNQKLVHSQRNVTTGRTDEKRIFEAKQKQMKSLLSAYYLERKKLENQLESKEGQIEQILIREKFLIGENQRLNREYVRWKQRYQWIEKEKETRQKQIEEEKNQILNQFQDYKSEHNQGVYMQCKVETDQANRKIQEYKAVVQNIMTKLEEQRQNTFKKLEQNKAYYENSEKQWLEKVKQLEKSKEEQILDLNDHHEYREQALREQYEKKSELLESEMQARIKALLAENDKKAAKKHLALSAQNEQLRRQLQILREHYDAKETYENTIKRNNGYYRQKTSRSSNQRQFTQRQ